MTVASWEFRSLAVTLVGTHGDDAEAEAQRRLAKATKRNDRGQMVVWNEVIKRLPSVREAAIR